MTAVTNQFGKGAGVTPTNQIVEALCYAAASDRVKMASFDLLTTRRAARPMVAGHFCPSVAASRLIRIAAKIDYYHSDQFAQECRFELDASGRVTSRAWESVKDQVVC